MDHSMQVCGPRVKCIDVFGLILPKFSQPLDWLLLYRLLTCLGGAAMKKKNAISVSGKHLRFGDGLPKGPAGLGALKGELYCKMSVHKGPLCETTWDM